MGIMDATFETQARIATGHIGEAQRYLRGIAVCDVEGPNILTEVQESLEKAVKLIRIWAAKNDIRLQEAMRT